MHYYPMNLIINYFYKKLKITIIGNVILIFNFSTLMDRFTVYKLLIAFMCAYGVTLIALLAIYSNDEINNDNQTFVIHYTNDDFYYAAHYGLTTFLSNIFNVVSFVFFIKLLSVFIQKNDDTLNPNKYTDCPTKI